MYARWRLMYSMDMFTLIDRGLKLFFIIWIYVIIYQAVGFDWIW